MAANCCPDPWNNFAQLQSMTQATFSIGIGALDQSNVLRLAGSECNSSQMQ